MNSLDTVQRIVIAGAVAVGVIGIALTLSGTWALPSAPGPFAFQNPESQMPAEKKPDGDPGTFGQLTEFETALGNSVTPNTALDEFSIAATVDLLPQLLALQESSIAQTEGGKKQDQIIEERVAELLKDVPSTIVVPKPVVIIAKDSSRNSKRLYVDGILTLEDDIKSIHTFLSNRDNLSSEERMRVSVPKILLVYNRVLLAGEKIPVPPVWANLHTQAIHGLSTQAIGLSAILEFRTSPLAVPYAIQAFFDGLREYKIADEAFQKQLVKEGFTK